MLDIYSGNIVEYKEILKKTWHRIGDWKLKKVAVVGVYGEGTEFTTGQAVKCKVVIDWLKKEYGTDEIIVVNTYKWNRNPIKMLYNTIKVLLYVKIL